MAMKPKTALIILLIITVIVATALSGCIDNQSSSKISTVSSGSKFTGMNIQKELKTTEGLVVKLEISGDGNTEWLNCIVENPTSKPVEISRAGVLYEYADPKSMDGRKAWRTFNAMCDMSDTIQPRCKETYTHIFLSDDTTQAFPYVKVKGSVRGEWREYPSTQGMNSGSFTPDTNPPPE